MQKPYIPGHLKHPINSCIVVKHWHRLPREVVDVSSLETSNVRLDGALSRWVSLFVQGGWTRWLLGVPWNSNDSMIQ